MNPDQPPARDYSWRRTHDALPDISLIVWISAGGGTALLACHTGSEWVSATNDRPLPFIPIYWQHLRLPEWPDQPHAPMKNETPITKLPDDSGCFTATILSRDEAMALPLKDRPLNYRISSAIYHAVFEAVGAASLCWNPKPGDEVFDASAASKIATDLCFKIAEDIEKTFPDQPPAPHPILETMAAPKEGFGWTLIPGENPNRHASWKQRPKQPPALIRRFRKKPVVIEAIQFTSKHLDECVAFCGGEYEYRTAAQDAPFGEVLHIKTLEGTMTAVLGDWIIKGVKGEFYPCKPDILGATYESTDLAPTPNVSETPRRLKL